VASGVGDPVPERVRTTCAWVARRARFVRIEERALPTYAAALSRSVEAPPPDPATDLLEADGEARAAFVLRLDGVLRLDPGLEHRIEAGELLEHGSPEEVELRACSVHAVELLAAATPLSPAEIDGVLWNRGAAERYKSVPRPRSRNTAY
jgi:Potential Queuosine, Q, salvage protein family